MIFVCRALSFSFNSREVSESLRAAVAAEDWNTAAVRHSALRAVHWDAKSLVGVALVAAAVAVAIHPEEGERNAVGCQCWAVEVGPAVVVVAAVAVVDTLPDFGCIHHRHHSFLRD